jgi:hypothetical protein
VAQGLPKLTIWKASSALASVRITKRPRRVATRYKVSVTVAVSLKALCTIGVHNGAGILS